jgi:plasmid stabilization system protein ParE
MAEKVIWTATAREHLHAIALEIARNRPSVAERFCLELIQRADAVGDFPRAGRKMPELDDENVREIIHPLPDHLRVVSLSSSARNHARMAQCARNPEIQRSQA